jgi:multidrug efflux pump subunit AcrA (membrane-fusion protein)
MNGAASRVSGALALMLVLGSCMKEGPPSVSEERVLVSTVTLKEGRVPQEISCFGTITFARKIDLAATVDGTVEQLLAKESRAVRQGQQLVVLKNVQLQLRRQQALSGIDSARAALDLAHARLWEGEMAVEARMVSIERTELEREQKLLEVEDAVQTLANKEELSKVGGVTPEALSAVRLRLKAARNEAAMIEKDLFSRRIGLRDADLERDGIAPLRDFPAKMRQLVVLNTKTLQAEVAAARAHYESARRELEAAEELLNALVIVAPAEGVVGATYVEPGEYVAKNGKMLTLMETKNVYAALSVQESEMPLLREGMPARVWVEAFSDQALSGTVDFISPSADPQTGAFLVKAAVANAKGALRPGMFARATIAYEKPKSSLVIPEKCIFQKKGTTAQVYNVVNGKAFLRQVTVGRNLGGSFAVEKGLNQGDIVIESPPPTLREGMNVEISN